MAKARVWNFMGAAQYLAFDGESEVHKIAATLRRSIVTVPQLDREVRNYPNLYKVEDIELPDELYGKEVREKYPLPEPRVYQRLIV